MLASGWRLVLLPAGFSGSLPCTSSSRLQITNAYPSISRDESCPWPPRGADPLPRTAEEPLASHPDTWGTNRKESHAGEQGLARHTKAKVTVLIQHAEQTVSTWCENHSYPSLTPPRIQPPPPTAVYNVTRAPIFPILRPLHWPKSLKQVHAPTDHTPSVPQFFPPNKTSLPRLSPAPSRTNILPSLAATTPEHRPSTLPPPAPPLRPNRPPQQA